MTKSILITQCLQNDFVAPIDPHQPIPNELHVDASEALRLVGRDPRSGPLAQLMNWARSQEPARLEIIHIRDWHCLDDPAQQQHLQQFGPHCIADTPGAELVISDDSVCRLNNEHFVNSTTLNDFEGSDLGDLIGFVKAGAADSKLRVGVVGVWTEAKITFLLYELLTRCGIGQLATCSALTASASRAQHFIALDQLRKILGVQVIDSIGEFASWLVPKGIAMAPPGVARTMRPDIRLLDRAACLDDEDLDVLAYLYRDSAQLKLQSLTGGFSGAGVFRVYASDSMGHSHAATVVKIGPRELIAQERVAFERVEPILGNDAPTIRDFVDFSRRAGIKYAYAAMGDVHVRTFKSLYEQEARGKQIEAILETVFGEILSRFQAVAQYEKLPLADYYTFAPEFAEDVRGKIAELVGSAAAGSTRITFPGEYEVGNVADFYATRLNELPKPPGESHFVAYIHGDLNAANILVDDRDNVWLIDFLHAHRGHCLRDLAKLENDLLYICTPLQSDDELAEALQLTDVLRCVKDLRAPLAESIGVLDNPQLQRAWQTIRVIRRIVAQYCREERDPRHYHLALLRYAVHTLSFDESNDWQKRWALAASGAIADDLLRAARENRELRIAWLPDQQDAGVVARVGLTICPGRRDRGRQLEVDLKTLVDQGVGRLLSLITAGEIEMVGVERLFEEAAAQGLQVRHEPIPDQQAPAADRLAGILDWIDDGLTDTVIHCLGGLGRAGTVSACLLVRRGWTANEAIAAVRKARGPRAVETTVQVKFVHRFAAECNDG